MQKFSTALKNAASFPGSVSRRKTDEENICDALMITQCDIRPFPAFGGGP
jgi:hypothetical protein